MQTFLPYASFPASAAVLDRQRLGKQRVENLQILKALTTPSYGWQNHPAVRMWRGFESALVEYQAAICTEWHHVRGYKDTCMSKTYALIRTTDIDECNTYPSWLGDSDFHRSHRSNLLRKDEEWYRQFGWSEPTDLDYVWPV